MLSRNLRKKGPVLITYKDAVYSYKKALSPDEMSIPSVRTLGYIHRETKDIIDVCVLHVSKTCERGILIPKDAIEEIHLCEQ